MRFRRASGASGPAALALVATAIAAAILAAPAGASVAHVVVAGESLSSVAAVNGLSTESLAAFNGLSSESWLYEGQTIQIPSADEAAATGTSTTTSSAPAASSSYYGMATISGPLGSVQLDAAAASAWESMRAAALSGYGVDLYPAGTLSGYRTWEQQSYLYDLFLSGEGAPANPPGTSTHELGIAVDVPETVMADIIDQIGPTYGWYGIDSEWWHFEYWG
jgi:LysM domain/D-alanyl-D-alanine carboxypeptidase